MTRTFNIIPGRAPLRMRTTDGFMTYDASVVSSTGSFLVGELERLDQTLHEPLVAYTWSRDINLRTDVGMGDEVSSFTNSTFAGAGMTPGGKHWIGKDANAIGSIALDIGKTTNPLYLWGLEISYTLPELASAAQLGRPIDTQKYNAMKLKHQMDTDEQVYIGDTVLNNEGLLNSSLVTSETAAVAGDTSPTGNTTSTLWTDKTPDLILADVNTLLTDCWEATGWSVMPSKLLLPPAQFSYLVSQKINSLGSMSIMTYIKENNLVKTGTGRDLDIQPVKWATGRGSDSTDRMMAYTNEEDRVRFPMVPLQHTPVEYRSIYQMTTYYGRLGVVEWVYPETGRYMDGI